MTITVETTKGPVEVEPEEFQRALASLDYGFAYVRQRSGLSHDAVMMACNIASKGNLMVTYALYELLKERELIPYQDTRNQIRYTREGDFDPFHESYQEERKKIIGKLERGYTVKYTASNSVHNRVIYDLIADKKVNKVRNGIQARNIDLLLQDDRDE